MSKMAARVFDRVAHPVPGMLMPGPGSSNVHIGNIPAWRGLPAAAAAALQAAKAVSDAVVTAAEAAKTAAMGTPGAPAAIAAEQAAKAAATAALGSLMNSLAGACSALGGMPDLHVCGTPPIPPPPHGPGMVIDGSPTVLINGLPACAVGDHVLEALGPLDPIVMGMPTVFVGKAGGAGGGGLGGIIAAAVAAFLDGVRDVVNAVKNIVQFVNDLVKAVIDAVVAAAARVAKAIINAVVDALNKFKDAFEKAVDSFKPPFERNKEKAIEDIKSSDFGKTAEGKKVVDKIEQLNKDGKIVSKDLKPTTRGEWGSDGIVVNSDYENDSEAIASELVHEATHALNEDEFPESKKKITIDEEMRTNENQLDYYEEQRNRGFRDPELEDRRDDRADGKLRDNVRRRYPRTAEHL